MKPRLAHSDTLASPVDQKAVQLTVRNYVNQEPRLSVDDTEFSILERPSTLRSVRATSLSPPPPKPKNYFCRNYFGIACMAAITLLTAVVVGVIIYALYHRPMW